MLKKYLIFILIIVLASFLRFYQLGKIPSGITNDEAGYIYSAYSIWKTGHDLAGKFLPLSINLDNSFSPVHIYMAVPFVGLLGPSPFSGRLPDAILGVGSVILLFFITQELFGNRKIALFSSFVLAISPWDLQVSRGAWEVNVALFFYLLATYIFIKNVKSLAVLWSIPFFLLAFYSYHADKIFFIFYFPLLIFLYRKELLSNYKKVLLLAIAFLILIFSFLFISKTQDVTRQKVFLWTDLTKMSNVVNWERDRNTAPWFIRELLSNKPLYILRVIRENYLEAFSPQYLFIYGETGGLGGTFGVFFRGVMYIIELPLLLIGVYCLIRQEKSRIRNLVLFSLLLAPLPTAFTTDKTFVMRCIMMLPFLSILVGYGIFSVLEYLNSKSKFIKNFLLIILVSFYSFLFVEYLYQYYSRYSIYGAESWFKSSRDLSIYVGEKKNNYKNIYLINAGNMFLLQYGIFNKIDPSIMQKAWQSNSKKLGNIILMNLNCSSFDLGKVDRENNMYIIPDDCAKNSTPTAKIKDLGEPLRTIWKIYESK